MHDLLNDPHLVGVPVIDGFKVLDPCVLFARLGQGGMGAVYRGKHLNLDIDVAVKCLKRSLAEESPELVQRFEREAKIAAKINSDGLVRVYDVGRQFGINYFVMEMIVGETLTQRVRRKGPLPIHEAAAIIARAARGLADAHELGIIHRDIKPDNVMITVRGQVKVADLGLARAKEAMDSLQTHSRMVMGTPQFMPLEQFAGAAQTSPASDVYSLGATLYFMLAGQPPFAGASMTEIMYQVANTRFPNVLDSRPDCPIELAAIINESTQREASRRHPDAMKFAAAVEEFLFSQRVSPNLADPGASASTKTGDLVSPPPIETMAKIRSAVREKRSDPGAAAARPSSETPGPTRLASEFRSFDDGATPVPGQPPPTPSSDPARSAPHSGPVARIPSPPPSRPSSSPPIPPIIATPPPLPSGRVATPQPVRPRSEPARIPSPTPWSGPTPQPAAPYENHRAVAGGAGHFAKEPYPNRWWLIPVLFFGALGIGILIILAAQEMA